MRTIALAACTLAGCAYEPSSFSFLARPATATATRATVGCLDLAITPRPSVERDQHVIAYAFGNRCDRPAIVDLSRHPVIGHAADGATYTLAAFDPRRELQPAMLDGRDQGTELIAYPSGVALVDVCVDAAAIAHHAPSTWLCVLTASP